MFLKMFDEKAVKMYPVIMYSYSMPYSHLELFNTMIKKVLRTLKKDRMKRNLTYVRYK